MLFRTRLGLGFGSLILVVVALGGASYVMFRHVATDVDDLSRNRLAAARRAAVVERLALEAINGQADLAAGRVEESRAWVAERIKSLGAELSELDEIASCGSDAALADEVAKARASLAEFSQFFDRGIAAVRSSAEEELRMAEKGAAGDREVNALVRRKKAEYIEAKDALAIANSVNAAALDMRMNEKAYMLEHDPERLSAIGRDVEQICQSCDELAKLHPTEVEKKQIALARATTEEYAKAVKTWAERQKAGVKASELAELAKTMNRTGDTLSQFVDDYTTCKQGAVEKTAQSVFVVREIDSATADARLCEKSYARTRSEKQWADHLRNIGSLKIHYDALKKLADSAEDGLLIDAATKAVADYAAAAAAWHRVDRSLHQDLLPKMRENGARLIAAAQTVQQDAWEASTEVSDDAIRMATNSLWVILASVAVAVSAGSLLAVVITRSVTRPLRKTVSLLKDIAEGEGDLTRRLEVARNDELGELARWFNVFVEKIQGIIRQIQGYTAGLSGASTELAGAASSLAGSAEETTSQSACVAAAAEQMSANMTTMAASTEQMSQNIRVVATAVEELTASITEVAKSAERAAGVADNAEQLVTASNAQIGALESAAEQIGKVIQAIEDIADQTNLLALNATIEAARAGEAGKGFAVVASEVKELARQTAAATEDVRQRIGGIRDCTGNAIRSIGDISEVVRQVNGLSRTIASTVEEQSITTKEIAQNVSQSSVAAQTVAQGVAESASASREISRTIVGVDQAAKQAAEGASQTRTTGQDLSQMAGELRSVVGQFNV